MTEACSTNYTRVYPPSSICELSGQIVTDTQFLSEQISKILLFCPSECPRNLVNDSLTTLIEKGLRLRSMVCNQAVPNRIVITDGPREAICEIDELADGSTFYYCRITGTTTQFGAYTIEQAKNLLS